MTTATCPIPPFIKPTIFFANSTSLKVKPPRFMISPANIKSGIAVKLNESAPPYKCCGITSNGIGTLLVILVKAIIIIGLTIKTNAISIPKKISTNSNTNNSSNSIDSLLPYSAPRIITNKFFIAFIMINRNPSGNTKVNNPFESLIEGVGESNNSNPN